MNAECYGQAATNNQNNNLNDYSAVPCYKEEFATVKCANEENLTPVQKFYDGTNILITGSSGFLGRILVEKLLRSCPTISTLYLLVRNKKGKSVEERVDEMFNDVLFDRLRNECPKFRNKVVGVAGDCTLPELGLSPQDKRLLIDEINILFHLAATIRFDAELKTAVFINIRSVRDLLNFGEEMKNLKSFIHVSTMYGNCLQSCIEEKIYPPAFDGEKLISLAENMPENIIDDMTPKLLGDFPNTYTYTKQIAEDIVSKKSGNIPVGIFRPAIVVSTYREPIESWNSNLYGPAAIVTSASIGLMRTAYCDLDANANLVPADMCVNSLIAAAWEVNDSYQKAVAQQKPFEIPVYNYGSSNDQPITWGSFMDNFSSYSVTYPSVNSIWYYSFSAYKYYPLYLFCSFLFHTLPAFFIDTALLCMGKKTRFMGAYRKIHKLSNVLSFFTTRSWKMKSDKVRELQKNMCEHDKEIFFSNLQDLDWDEYFKGYLKGLRQYVLHEPVEATDAVKAADIRWRRFYIAHQIFKLLSRLVLFYVGYWLIKICLNHAR